MGSILLLVRLFKHREHLPAVAAGSPEGEVVAVVAAAGDKIRPRPDQSREFKLLKSV